MNNEENNPKIWPIGEAFACFVSALINKPVEETYSYHGLIKKCKRQPDPGMFDCFLVNIETTKVYTTDAYLIELHSAYLEGRIELKFGAKNCTIRGFEWGKTTNYGEVVYEIGSFGAGYYNLQITF